MADEYAPYELDNNNLDEQWVKQPQMYFYAARELADARKDQETTNTDKEVTEAEVAMEIRKDPQLFGLEKVTEAGIQSALVIDKRVRKATAECIEARHLVDVLKAKVDMLDHRKKALENLVHLHSMEYFSVPKAPKESRERMSEVEKKAVRKRGQRNAND